MGNLLLNYDLDPCGHFRSTRLHHVVLPGLIMCRLRSPLLGVMPLKPSALPCSSRSSWGPASWENAWRVAIVAIALLVNSVATGAGLVAVILTFGPISGAHLNPAVTWPMRPQVDSPGAWCQDMCWRRLWVPIVGVACAHGMFDLPPLAVSQHVRTGPSQWFSEFIATFGLFAVIWSGVRHHARLIPYAVGLHHRSLLVHCVDLVR
jgi:hypothetical protein